MQPVQPAPRETLPSYLSRLAASKGVATPEFAYDLAGSFKRFLRCDPKVVEGLSGWAGLSEVNTDELLSWTGVPVGEVRMQYRGDTVISRAIRNPIVEGCAVCLREDALSTPEMPLSAMVMRGDWQLREVSVCLRHHRLLVPLWTEALPVARFDFQAKLSRILTRILSGELDGAAVDPSPFDIWLDGRLDGRPDTTWLGPHGTVASAAFCRMFGEGMLRDLPAENPVRARQEAAAAGYCIVKGGPEAIKSHLIGLSARAGTVSDPVRHAHGQMFFALESHLRDDPTFDFVRDVLRDAVLDIWPVAAGESVLGTALERRRLHSVASAAAELRTRPDRLRQLLIEAGALAARDPRPNARAVFPSDAFAPLLADISRLQPDKVMRKKLGATEAELITLEQAGILRPRTAIPEARLRWHPADADALLDELHTYARGTRSESGKGWATHQVAQARTGLSVGAIFAGIRAGAIRIRHDGMTAGYHGFQIAVDDARGLTLKPDSAPQKRLSLAAFGRDIGIRASEQLLALVQTGDLQAELEVHAVTRRRTWWVSESGVAAFHARFLTLTTLQRDYGLQRNVSRSILKHAAVEACSLRMADSGSIYLRSEVEPALRKSGHLKS